MSDLKPIQTEYRGHRFRSRLEARWAVFFDSLGVKWEYEKEGYELPGGRYLPDFWLPEVGAGCFVEIKAGELNSDEERKARELADASGAFTMVFCGNPWPGEYRAWQFYRKPMLPEELKAPLMAAVGTPLANQLAHIIKFHNYYLPDFVAATQGTVLGMNFYSPVAITERPICWCRYHRCMFFGFYSARHCQCQCGDFHDHATYQDPVPYGCRWFRQQAEDHGEDCDEISEGHELQQAFRAARSARFEFGETPA